MPQKRHTVDQIVAKLRKADVELGKGKKVPEICKLLEVTEQTYYRWRQKYGGMKPVGSKNSAEPQTPRMYGFNRLRSVNLDRTELRNCVGNVSAIVLSRTTTSLDHAQDRPRSLTFWPTPMIVLDLPVGSKKSNAHFVR